MIDIRNFRSADPETARFNSKSSVAMVIPCLNIKAGKVYALIGKSGSGKSLLLSLLMGYPAFPFTKSVSANRFSIFGQDLKLEHFFSNTTYLRQMTCSLQQGDMLYLPQHLPLCCSRKLPARRSLLLTLEALTRNRVNLAELHERFASHNLLAELEKPLTALSGGERRRCELLIRLIAAEKKRKKTVLLLDEPTTGFDQTSSLSFMREIRAEIDSMTQKGVPISAVISTHNLEFLDKQHDLFDEIIVVHRDLISSSSFTHSCCAVIYQGVAHGFLSMVSQITKCFDITSMHDHRIYELLDKHPSSEWIHFASSPNPDINVE